MAKSTKRYSNFDEVARDMNILFDAINNKQQSIGDNSAGREGNLRIVEGADKKIYLELRGRYGWYTSCTDVFQFKGYFRPELLTTSVSSQIYFAKKIITSTDVPSTVLLGTVPAGYTLRSISGKINTAFGSDNLIQFSDGGILDTDNIIDLRIANMVFDLPLNKPYVSNTDINAILTGTASTGSVTVYLEAIKEI